MADEKKISYKDSLNLPKTDFPIRPDSKVEDKLILERWVKDDLYFKSFIANEGSEKYILHDGPPYANGPIHIGHAYNKILKDIVTKSQRMSGKHVPVTPGWDCHGLPIELKVSKENPGVSRSELQKLCREYAKKWIDIQRDQFKDLGVLMNWAHPYLTMNFKYEAATIRAFGKFVDQGLIEKKNKTVSWCASCQTVLASAEIEYQERKDPSIYVKFPIKFDSASEFFSKFKDKEISFLVWTTTPWTLPLNRAVLLKPKTDYVVLNYNTDLGQYLVVGESLADGICKMLEIKKDIVAKISSEQLQDVKALHPFNGKYVPVLLEGFVSTEDGTAAVHCAPGCGPEDYEVGVRNELEIYSPISPDGKYTKGVEPAQLEGISVADAQGWVIKNLTEGGRLIHKTSIRHSYPHCWRCRNGLIFRATKQWFCNLSRKNLKERAFQAIDKINFIPKQSANSLRAAIENRLEWCLSRQRVWGTPIPALICKKCDHPYISVELVNRVAQGVEREGIEFWDHVAINELVDKDFSCVECGAQHFEKEYDILDVWFDSGVSSYAVLIDNPILGYPANMYLEGRDQARGWFQSSLLSSLVLEDEASMKSIVTHGFTVDERGQKMSKSLGNVVSPQEVIDELGTDGLRLWASSIDFKDDAVVSKVLFQNVKEVYRKIRNTCRFLLSNLYDFDISKDSIDLDKLLFVDRYALFELRNFNNEILKCYEDCKFTTIFHLISDYCSKDLSSFYLDIIKDRLYVDEQNSLERRSAQTVCWYILDTLTHLIAPILSFTAELVSDEYQKNKKESIHLQKFTDIGKVWEKLSKSLFVSESQEMLSVSKKGSDASIEIINSELEYRNLWSTIFEIRSALLKAIERQREKGLIKHPLEAQLIVHYDNSNKEIVRAFTSLQNSQELLGKDTADFFKELMVVSGFIISNEKQQETDLNGLSVTVKKAEGQKCPRCWKFEVSDRLENLCNRCFDIVK
jgi:isoleucyl-tRNA synthetase